MEGGLKSSRVGSKMFLHKQNNYTFLLYFKSTKALNTTKHA